MNYFNFVEDCGARFILSGLKKMCLVKGMTTSTTSPVCHWRWGILLFQLVRKHSSVEAAIAYCKHINCTLLTTQQYFACSPTSLSCVWSNTNLSQQDNCLMQTRRTSYSNKTHILQQQDARLTLIRRTSCADKTLVLSPMVCIARSCAIHRWGVSKVQLCREQSVLVLCAKRSCKSPLVVKNNCKICQL